eukprot:MONOS_1565.1-p1 / transcript=MONOS_1565.1 / gene=MONOS_1565 / organism=Monocercomonoides_exilis_PA203 / gene_product=Peptidyl-prolyl cis-trans isomerase-like 4 / transcript_product=Peptidyl-prolyl cis-trans isomerase-like 4 / location=Mono_scaffold00028:45011-46741(-) / protein_length=379 / sequence_SO=supercontig / SO=protein_coding / is_pseudo=false
MRILEGPEKRFFKDEISPLLRHEKIGTVSMAHGKENENASQFFITLDENLASLDGIYTIFGQVVEGIDVLMEMNEMIVDEKRKPIQNMRIYHTIVLFDPFADLPGMIALVPPSSPIIEPKKYLDYLPEDYEDVDEEGPEKEEMEVERIAAQTARSNAVALEILGDLPDASVKPPERTLFVCKLNPVTDEEGLTLIFSRFGAITKCDVVRDPISHKSKCYAFIEFEKKADCEAAYFAMNNCLIDDRRILVDFSQSVSRQKYIPSITRHVEEVKRRLRALKEKERKNSSRFEPKRESGREHSRTSVRVSRWGTLSSEQANSKKKDDNASSTESESSSPTSIRKHHRSHDHEMKRDKSHSKERSHHSRHHHSTHHHSHKIK